MKPFRFNRRKLLLIIAVAVLISGAAWRLVSRAKSSAANWEIVRRGDLTLEIPIIGALNASRSVDITAPISNDPHFFKIARMTPEGSQVEAGQMVDALPDEKLTGKVVSVGSVLRMRRWDNPVKVIDAVIELEQKIGKLSPGMTATGQIEVERVANALLAPVKAVREKGGQVIVRVPAAGESGEERAIRVGRRNQQFVEVLEGLREGEKVIMP